MNERKQLLTDIAAMIVDYREGEVPRPTPDHIERWVHQFGEDVQWPLLCELKHVLAQTYFSQAYVSAFLDFLLEYEQLAGKNPQEFWSRVNFLAIQQHGCSQHDMLGLFDKQLVKRFGIGVTDCGSLNGSYIYLDDAVFSGGRACLDLQTWLEQDAPEKGTVHIIVIASHSYGQYALRQRLGETADSLGKDINFIIWRVRTFENRRSHRAHSQVLWPATLPDNQDLAAYMALEQRYPFQPRQAVCKSSGAVFSSEEGRNLLEREFLLAGIRIRSFYKNPKSVLRPLGFSNFGLGFGSTIVTYRNCPNNCPLALWFGDTSSQYPWLRKWYPLFPRKTYSREVDSYDF